jgi:hypothetical protein
VQKCLLLEILAMRFVWMICTYHIFHLKIYCVHVLSFLEILIGWFFASCSHGMFKSNQVFDQFCHFVSLESHLVSLNLPNTFSLIHSKRTPEAQQEQLVHSLVDGLFSLCVTLVGFALI